MNKTNVEIVKETAKAKLVQDSEGRQGWVMNKSYSDGLVNSKTFEKSVEKMAGFKSLVEEKKEADKSFAPIIEIKKSTDKAVCLSAFWEEEITDQTGYRDIWIPKSLLNEHEAVPVWFLRKKATELREALTKQRGAYFTVHVCGVEFAGI
jgi:SH3-like domain-containing protein